MIEGEGRPRWNESDQDRIPPLPRVWIPAVIAVVLPLAWIYYREADQMHWFGILHFYLVPIYIPLVFGLTWPVAIGLQLRSLPFVRWVRLPRVWVAVLLFVFSAPLSANFMIRGEYESYRQDRNRLRSEELQRQQEPAEWSRAQQEIKSNGIAAFTEPLTPIQHQVLGRYIYENVLTPADAKIASEHYQTEISVMIDLAEKKEVTDEALNVLYENALRLRRRPELGSASEVFFAIGKNPNVSVSLLTRMVESEDPAVRLGASENPKLPKAVKLAYLKRAWSSQWSSERERVAEDPDTPAEVLEQLGPDPAAVWGLARNPKTPLSVLEKLATSKDPWLQDQELRKEVLANLAKRRQSRQ